MQMSYLICPIDKNNSKKHNKNPTVFTGIAKKLKSMFPQDNIKIGMHTEASNLYNVGYVQNKNMYAVSACVELENDNVNLRIFRPGADGVKYKIDMIEGVNKSVSYVVPKSEFDHYIYTDIPENIMGRNNISIKFIVDKDGYFVPKIDDKGMLEAFINFPDPYEKLRKQNE